MTCEACGNRYPGKYIKVDSDYRCLECGKRVPSNIDNIDKWDNYFHSICVAISLNSPCMSRKIGAILVRDKSIISTGYNGSARGIPHCGKDRFLLDDSLKGMTDSRLSKELYSPAEINNTCPRQLLGFDSGQGLQYCPAQHAEVNCISNAARLGISVLNSTLYMNSVIPCKNCFSTLINAGIVEIVVDKVTFYDTYTPFIANNSSIKIRSFNN